MKEDNGKILGVIGGMGPLATQMFYKMVIDKTKAECDQDHINMIIMSHATIPDRTSAILSGNMNKVVDCLKSDCETLAEAGAEYVAVTCNTSHYMLNMIKDELPLKLIHMMDTAAEKISKLYPKGRIGILATDGTNKTGLYFDALSERGLTPVVLSVESQEKVMSIIYDYVKKGIDVDMNLLYEVEKELVAKEADCALLACTELSCLKIMKDLSEFYIDAMDALAEKAVLLCGKELKDGK